MFLAFLYDGKANFIRMKREYFVDYGCLFELHRYPFDIQVIWLMKIALQLLIKSFKCQTAKGYTDLGVLANVWDGDGHI